MVRRIRNTTLLVDLWRRRAITCGPKEISFIEHRVDCGILAVYIHIWVVFLGHRHDNTFRSCREWNTSGNHVSNGQLGRRSLLRSNLLSWNDSTFRDSHG